MDFSLLLWTAMFLVAVPVWISIEYSLRGQWGSGAIDTRHYEMHMRTLVRVSR